MKKEIEIIEHKGKKIAMVDLSNTSPEDVIEITNSTKAWFEKQPEHSLLTLTNVEGLHFNTSAVDALKEYTAHNKPYVKVGAIIGLRGLQRVAYNVIMAFSKRNLPVFDTKEQAMDWLVEQ